MAASAAAKPSTRTQLMQAGRDVLQAHGFQGLTVRAVAAAADANLGSFVYHFGTRDAFVAELIEEWYAPMMSRVTSIDSAASPIERLRLAIVQIVDFVGENESFIGHLFAAALSGDRSTRDFLGSLAGRHPRVLLHLIGEAQVAGQIVDEDPLQVACFLMSSVALPRLLASGWQGPPLFGKTLAAALSLAASGKSVVPQ